MNCSKNIKKTSIGKRIMVSWVIFAVIFALIGFGIGKLTSIPEKQNVSKNDVQKEILIYGLPDGKIFSWDMPVEWESSLEFTPLNVPMDEELQRFVFYLSAGYDIDFTLVMAMIQQESSFQTDVISNSNDYGLMQINEMNHPYLTEQLGITDFTEPHNNIRSGMFILRKLFEKYESPEKVLMAYNMGEYGASILWNQGIFESNYSRKVLEYQQQFKEQFERGANHD